MDLSFGFCLVGCCESGYPVVQSSKLKATLITLHAPVYLVSSGAI